MLQDLCHFEIFFQVRNRHSVNHQQLHMSAEHSSGAGQLTTYDLRKAINASLELGPCWGLPLSALKLVEL